eukprot:g569.t1
MQQNRSAGPHGTPGTGPQVPQPDKFPLGMRVVADHSVQQWANWTVDLMKDDSCGSCGRPVEDDYRVMQSAIRTVGRPMVLTIEGSPNITEVHTRAAAATPGASGTTSRPPGCR